jgi:hypothetical protein
METGRRLDLRPSITVDVPLAQSILYRGAGIDVVWPQFAIVALIGSLFLGLSILRFRSVDLASAITSEIPHYSSRKQRPPTNAFGLPAQGRAGGRGGRMVTFALLSLPRCRWHYCHIADIARRDDPGWGQAQAPSRTFPGYWPRQMGQLSCSRRIKDCTISWRALLTRHS